MTVQDIFNSTAVYKNDEYGDDFNWDKCDYFD